MIKKIVLTVFIIILFAVGALIWAFSGRDPLQQYLSQRSQRTSLTLKSVFTDGERFGLVCPGATDNEISDFAGKSIPTPSEDKNLIIVVTGKDATAYEYKRSDIDFCSIQTGDPYTMKTSDGNDTFTFVQPEQTPRWVLQDPNFFN